MSVFFVVYTYGDSPEMVRACESSIEAAYEKGKNLFKDDPPDSMGFTGRVEIRRWNIGQVPRHSRTGVIEYEVVALRHGGGPMLWAWPAAAIK